MAEDFDYTLFGDLLVKPSTGESADPMTVLTDKVVSFLCVWFESFIAAAKTIRLEPILTGTFMLPNLDYVVFRSSLVGT
jgi:hypothetical protein